MTTISATLMWLVVTVFSGSDVTLFVSEIAVGASFTSVRLIVNARSVERPPASVERTRIEYKLRSSKSKAAAVLSVKPSIKKAALSLSPVPEASEYVNVSLMSMSMSVVERVPTAVPMGVFSGISADETAILVGSRLGKPSGKLVVQFPNINDSTSDTTSTPSRPSIRSATTNRPAASRSTKYSLRLPRKTTVSVPLPPQMKSSPLSPANQSSPSSPES